MKKKALLLMLVLMFISTNALSQNIIYGRISGDVQAGINVELYRTHCGADILEDTVTSNSEGYYAFGCLDNGTYKVEPKKEGYSIEPELINVQIPQSVIQSYDFIATEVIRFVVTGDSRGNSGDPDGVSNEILGELAAAMLNDSPEFVLFVGDLVWGWANAGTLDSQLATWISVMQPLYDAGVNVYPVRGNHELGGSKEEWDTAFSGAYDLPDNGPIGEENITYSFTHKSVFVVGLDQYVNAHTVNQSWLDDQFEANNQPHVFVFGHEPAFKTFHTACLDDNVTERDEFWDSIKAEGGRIYFCGHDHFYDHARIDDGNGDPGDDLHQFIVGTGGADLYSGTFDYDGDNSLWDPYGVYRESNYGYILVEIIGSNVTLEWKHRLAPGVYESGGDKLTYSVE